MRALLATILLTSGIWSAPSLLAQNIPQHRRVPVAFHCVVGTNPGSLAPNECASVITRAKTHYRATARIRLLARTIRYINEPAPQLITSPSNGLLYLNYLRNMLAGSYPRRIKYVVGQPWIDAAGNSWILGYANTVCSVAPRRIAYSVAYSLAANYNHRGEPRYWHSLNALIHELGHALGAEHSSETTIMHANALSYVRDNILSWSDIDFGWINACLNTRRE